MAAAIQVQVVCLSKNTVLNLTTVIFGLSGASTGVSKIMNVEEGQLFTVGDSYLLTIS